MVYLMREKEILLISDLHDSVSGLRKLKEWCQNSTFDLVLSAGDLTSTPNPNQIKALKTILSLLPQNVPFLGIAGNNEREETIAWMKEQNLFLEEKKLFGLRFVGISGWGEDIPQISEPFDQKTILITHVPPKNFPRGRIETEKFKNQPKMHFFGHLHHDFFERKIGDIRVIHIPSLLLGKGLVLTLPNFKIKTLD